MGKLDNKVCIITGCASGLGKQQAIRFAVEGAKLSICDVQEARLMETKQICEEKGAEVLAMAFDLSNADDIEKFVNITWWDACQQPMAAMTQHVPIVIALDAAKGQSLNRFDVDTHQLRC